MPVTPGMMALAWGLLSFFGFIITVTLLIWPIGQLEHVFGVSHVVTLGVWAFTWVLASGFLALAAARLVFGRWCEVRRLSWLLLFSGALVSAGNLAVLADWTIARYGASDPDFVGPTSLLFAVVAGVAVAGFGVRVAPGTAIWAPMLAVLGGPILATSIILENIPGLTDGLAPDSGPLAVVTLVSAAYIGVVVVTSVALLRRQFATSN
jgi:hypothetical protein